MQGLGLRGVLGFLGLQLFPQTLNPKLQSLQGFLGIEGFRILETSGSVCWGLRVAWGPWMYMGCFWSFGLRCRRVEGLQGFWDQGSKQGSWDGPDPLPPPPAEFPNNGEWIYILRRISVPFLSIRKPPKAVP